MATPVGYMRKRGNPNWGRPIPRVPALPTEFELQTKHLHLTALMYPSSLELHARLRALLMGHSSHPHSSVAPRSTS